MSKFKVGDKVVVVRDDGMTYIKKSDVETVALIDSYGDVKLAGKEQHGWYSPHRFELCIEATPQVSPKLRIATLDGDNVVVTITGKLTVRQIAQLMEVVG